MSEIKNNDKLTDVKANQVVQNMLFRCAEI